MRVYPKQRQDFVDALVREYPDVPEVRNLAKLLLRDGTTYKRYQEDWCCVEFDDRELWLKQRERAEDMLKERVRRRCAEFPKRWVVRKVRNAEGTWKETVGVYRSKGEAHGALTRKHAPGRTSHGFEVVELGVEPVFGGDPRGATIKLKVPSGRYDDWGATGICVPTS